MQDGKTALDKARAKSHGEVECLLSIIPNALCNYYVFVL